MKKYLLPIFTFLFSVFLSFSLLAQGNGNGNGGNGNGGNAGGGNGNGGNNGGNTYEIVGNQQPCVGTMETYTITPNPGNNAIVWDFDGPRAQANEVAWELISLSNDKTKATFRVGDKPGTVRAKPIPGSNNTENLPVHPGRGLQASINGPNAVCVNTDQVFRLVVSNLGNGKKAGKDISLDDLSITWNVTGFTVVSGQGTGTLTVRAASGFTGGSVSASVSVPGQNGGPNNNGKGVGPITGFCGGTVNASLQVGLGTNCAPPCPATTVAINGPTMVCPAQQEAITFTAGVNNGTANMTYNWGVPSGWLIRSGQGTNSIEVLVGNTAGQVSLAVSNNCGTTASDVHAVSFRPDCGTQTPCPATAVSITGPAMVCPAPADFSQDDLVTYVAEVTNGTSNMIYAWTVPSGWQIVAGAGSNTIQVRVGAAPGQVKVDVRNNCAAVASASRLIAFGNNCPTPTSECPTPTIAINGPGTVCANQAELVRYTASVANTSGTAITYNWAVPTGWQIISGFGSNEIEVKVGGTAGTISLNVSNNCGNQVAATRTVSLNSNCGSNPPVCKAPTVTVSGPTTFCAFQDEPLTFRANVINSTPELTYDWTIPADWFVISQNGPELVVNVGFEGGPVTVTVRNNCNEATDALLTEVDETCEPLEPLPVELISFTGESTKSGVLLTWSTATERNNDRFELERSQDGKTYAKLGQVKGKGTTNSRQVYTMRDGLANKGTYYYRLKQVDLNGDFEYSKVIAVKHTHGTALASLMVAPNPVSGGQFTLRLPEAATQAQVQILDMNGRLIATQNVAAGSLEASFSTQHLNMRPGVYLVKFKDGSNLSHARIVVR